MSRDSTSNSVFASASTTSESQANSVVLCNRSPLRDRTVRANQAAPTDRPSARQCLAPGRPRLMGTVNSYFGNDTNTRPSPHRAEKRTARIDGLLFGRASECQSVECISTGLASSSKSHLDFLVPSQKKHLTDEVDRRKSVLCTLRQAALDGGALQFTNRHVDQSGRLMSKRVREPEDRLERRLNPSAFNLGQPSTVHPGHASERLLRYTYRCSLARYDGTECSR